MLEELATGLGATIEPQPSYQREVDDLLMAAGVTEESHPLPESAPIRPHTPDNLSDDDIVSLLRDWFSKLPFKEKTGSIYYATVDTATGLPQGSAKRLIGTAVTKEGYGVETATDNLVRFRMLPLIMKVGGMP
jgi:hypothetical protein